MQNKFLIITNNHGNILTTAGKEHVLTVVATKFGTLSRSSKEYGRRFIEGAEMPTSGIMLESADGRNNAMIYPVTSEQ